jgi:hypothetical protein
MVRYRAIATGLPDGKDRVPPDERNRGADLWKSYRTVLKRVPRGVYGRPSIQKSVNPEIRQSRNPSIQKSINPEIHQSRNPSCLFGQLIGPSRSADYASR